jgi:hypothetical protein
MNIEQAGQALGLTPQAATDPASIEAAYAREVELRHPSKYAEGDRAAAEAWAGHLGAARDTLLLATRRRRLGPLAVTAIVVGSVLVAAAAITPIAFLGSALVTRLAEDPGAVLAGESQEPVHYTSGETLYTFPASVDYFVDDRYLERCSTELANGCWTAAVYPEADCALLEVSFAFSHDEDAVAPDFTRTTLQSKARAAEPVVLAWGDDDYDYSWIGDVVCLPAQESVPGEPA